MFMVKLWTDSSKNSREVVPFVTAMGLHLPVLLINDLPCSVLSCSSNSNFPIRNQLKFPSTESSKPPVKIKNKKTQNKKTMNYDLAKSGVALLVLGTKMSHF